MIIHVKLRKFIIFIRIITKLLRIMQEHRKKIPADRPPFDTQGFAMRLGQMVRHWPSTSALARAAGVSEGAIRHYLKAAVRPTHNNLQALALALGVSPRWLSEGEGALPPQVNEQGATSARTCPASLNTEQAAILGELLTWATLQPQSQHLLPLHWQQLLPAAYDLVRLAKAAGQAWPEKSLQALWALMDLA